MSSRASSSRARALGRDALALTLDMFRGARRRTNKSALDRARELVARGVIDEPAWTLRAELGVGHSPGAKGAFAIGTVSPSHGPKEGQALLPFLKVQMRVGEVPIDVGKLIKVA